MQTPLQITFRDMDYSPAIEDRIRAKGEKLERFHDTILGCHVVIESPQRHKHQGKLYNVRIDLTVPGAELVANRAQHEDVYVAIREAFDAAYRQLDEYAHRQRREVKVHNVARHGRISALFPAQGYGFLETPDRREIYFHRNAVVEPGFDRLEIGTEVIFVDEEGEQGPQARMVTVGKHGYQE